MFKAMILLKRKESDSMSDFENWWLNDHAPLAKSLPGLKKAVFNLSSSDGGGEYDGISELWFDSKEHFERAYSTEHGQKVAADSLANVSKRERILVNEIEIVG